MIAARDLEFLENRLMAPCTGALEAHERLRLLGRDTLAERLMLAMQALTDECREIRRELLDERRNAQLWAQDAKP